MSKLVHVGNAVFIKPVVAGAIAGLGEKYILHGSNITSLYFGGAVAAGIMVSGTIGALIEPHVPTSTSIASMLGKSLEARIIEVSTAGAASYAVNRFVLHNEWRTDMNSLLMRIGIIAVADVVAESVVDVLVHAHL